MGYVDKNKPEDWCVNCVNPLYLMINRVFCFVGEKDGIKYLKIDKGNKKLEDSILSIWNKVFRGIKYNIKKINHKCKLAECKGFPDCEIFSDFKIKDVSKNQLKNLVYKTEVMITSLIETLDFQNFNHMITSKV